MMTFLDPNDKMSSNILDHTTKISLSILAKQKLIHKQYRGVSPRKFKVKFKEKLFIIT
jgi:tRNA A37 threonylcarbamoyltransferase TsaD